jgi:hypothetical protein
MLSLQCILRWGSCLPRWMAMAGVFECVSCVMAVMAVMAVPVMLELRTQNNHKKAIIIYFLWLFVVH